MKKSLIPYNNKKTNCTQAILKWKKFIKKMNANKNKQTTKEKRTDKRKNFENKDQFSNTNDIIIFTIITVRGIVTLNRDLMLLYRQVKNSEIKPQ